MHARYNKWSQKRGRITRKHETTVMVRIVCGVSVPKAHLHHAGFKCVRTASCVIEMLTAAHIVFFGRYDYENVASEGAEAMMESLRAGPAQPGDDLGSGFELQGVRVCSSAEGTCFIFFTLLVSSLFCVSHGATFVLVVCQELLPLLLVVFSCSFGPVCRCPVFNGTRDW